MLRNLKKVQIGESKRMIWAADLHLCCFSRVDLIFHKSKISQNLSNCNAYIIIVFLMSTFSMQTGQYGCQIQSIQASLRV